MSTGLVTILVTRCTELTHNQHGQPAQVIDVGETVLDQQILEEYLAEMREYYPLTRYGAYFRLSSLSDLERSYVSSCLSAPGAVPPLG